MTITAAIIMVPLIGILGLALDMVIIHNVKSEAQLRLDTAVLASALEGGAQYTSEKKLKNWVKISSEPASHLYLMMPHYKKL